MVTARRSAPLVRLFHVAMLGLCACLAAAAEPAEDPVARRDPQEFFFIQTFGDLPEDMDAAVRDGKLGMLLFFEAEGCRYCQYMLRNIFSRQDVQNWYRARFVSIAVDIHGDVELKDFDGITLPSKVFAAQRRVTMTPVVAFINPQGEEIYRRLGMVKSPEEFLLIGKYIESGRYLDMEFADYARQQGLVPAARPLATPASETEPHPEAGND